MNFMFYNYHTSVTIVPVTDQNTNAKSKDAPNIMSIPYDLNSI